MTAPTPQTERRAERIRLLAQPVLAVALGAGVLVWAFARDLTVTQQASLSASNITTVVWQHVRITVTVVAIVVLIAVPLGTLLTQADFAVSHRFSSDSPISARPRPPSV